MVSQMYTDLQIHQVVCIKYVQLFVCRSYFKAVFKKKYSFMWMGLFSFKGAGPFPHFPGPMVDLWPQDCSFSISGWEEGPLEPACLSINIQRRVCPPGDNKRITGQNSGFLLLH